MDQSFDLVVVGAGPAGSAAALCGARAGLTTLLVDKADFPRDKLCGGLVTGRSSTRLQDLFDLPPEGAPDLFLPCASMRFMAGATELRQIDDTPPMYLTMRRRFDARLVAITRDRGVMLQTGAGLKAVRPDTGQITLSDGQVIGYGVLIGADGVNSAVARALFGRAYAPATIGFGLEAEVPPPASGVDNTVVLDFDAADWGYGWRFPKPHGHTVGVGGLHRHNPDMKARMQRQLDLAPHHGPAPIKGAFLPFGAVRRVPGRGNILLAGDAAGLVDPITGEGIAHALESGRLAAQAAAQALATDPARALPLYRHALRPLHRELRQARFWRRMIFSARMRPVFKASIARSSTTPRRFLALLAGDLTYDDLRRDLAMKVPGAVVKAVWRGRG